MRVVCVVREVGVRILNKGFDEWGMVRMEDAVVKI